jgi:Predicted ATPase of the ABC class
LTDKEAVNIFAEKGRIINGLDMSSFIRGEERAKYYIEQCSSSLISQTANVLEAVEVGKPLLLIDEDNSVTNFLYRDAKLKEYLQGKSTLFLLLRR